MINKGNIYANKEVKTSFTSLYFNVKPRNYFKFRLHLSCFSLSIFFSVEFSVFISDLVTYEEDYDRD